MISPRDAMARVIAGVRPLPAEQVALSAAWGRILAEDVSARVTQPPLDVSSMDGYAVRAADVAAAPVTLQVIGVSAAGHPLHQSLEAGQAARIFTGAPVPAGADTVIMQENTERPKDRDDQITITEGERAGHFIRQAGMDFSANQCLIKAGTRLTARHIGLIAAMNVPWLRVTRRPRVAILATGDELVMPGDPYQEGQIFSSNSLSLAAQVAALGGESLDLGIAADRQQSLSTLASAAKGADLLITIGGASVGDYDLVRQALGEDGLALNFYKVAVRPGKPLIFGHIQGIPLLGLPGNPVSANLTAALFLRPALEIMGGLGDAAERALARIDEGEETARLGRDLPANDQRQDYLRASLSRDPAGNLCATPFTRQDSALLADLAAADCLVIRRPHAAPAKAGEPVAILRFAHGVAGL